jgi:hypothetical protein
MAYKINKTDGSLLVEIIDSNIDQTTTDITIIGKNVSGYGEYINENFIKILENFANDSAPSNPIVGQIWFDTAENRLKVYDGAGFRIGAGPIVSGNQPPLIQGDTWINSSENQVYVNDGQDTFLVGPIYSRTQGISGPTVETILDTNNIPRTIVKFWVGNTLLGIFSKEVVEFTPLQSIAQFIGNIGPGFNQSTLPGQKFKITATKADSLVDSVGNIFDTDSFMKTETNTGSVGIVTLTNSLPLILGPGGNNEIRSDSNAFQIISNTSNQVFRIRTKNSATTKDAVTINSASEFVGIFNATPAYTLDVGGSMRVSGNLLVEGSTTTINSTNLVIEDHIIELAANADSSVSDNYADQGGIVLRGTTDHKLTWNLANTAWKSTESFDVASGRDYKVNGISVLNSTTLGPTVVSSSLTSLGNLSQLIVDNIFLNSNRITALNTDGDVEIEVNGTGKIRVIGPNARIAGVVDPVDPQDAATKNYVDETLRSRTLTLSMDITGLSDTDIEDVLAIIAPEPEYDVGAECRIHCTAQVITYPDVTLSSSTFPLTSGEIVKTFITVDKAGGSENQNVLVDFTTANMNLGSATVSVTRTNKLFRLLTDSTVTKWTFIGNL